MSNLDRHENEKVLCQLVGGVNKVAAEMGELPASLRHRLNGFLHWTPDFRIRLYSALSNLGVSKSIKDLNKSLKALEKKAGVC